MAQDEDLPDIAALYPADFDYWKDMETATVYDLALLSLGIEPRTIQELEHADSIEEHQPLHLGRQHEEFSRRLDVMRNSIQAGSLSVARQAPSLSTSHVSLAAFVRWAGERTWELPSDLKAIAPAARGPAAEVSQEPSRRQARKQETQRKHESWQQEAERIWGENPTWTVGKIAQIISENRNISGGKDIETIRRNIRKPRR